MKMVPPGQGSQPWISCGLLDYFLRVEDNALCSHSQCGSLVKFHMHY